MSDAPWELNWPCALILVGAPAIFVWYAVSGLTGGVWTHCIVAVSLLAPFCLALATWVHLSEEHMKDVRAYTFKKLETEQKRADVELEIAKLRRDLMAAKLRNQEGAARRKSAAGGYSLGVDH